MDQATGNIIKIKIRHQNRRTSRTWRCSSSASRSATNSLTLVCTNDFRRICSMSGLFLGLVASMSFTSARRFLEYWLDTLGNLPLMILPARPFRLSLSVDNKKQKSVNFVGVVLLFIWNIFALIGAKWLSLQVHGAPRYANRNSPAFSARVYNLILPTHMFGCAVPSKNAKRKPLLMHTGQRTMGGVVFWTHLVGVQVV